MNFQTGRIIMLGKKAKIASWVLQVLAAVILLQTLFFKFTGAPESVAIFSAMGAEPWGRIGSGVLELVASLLLLYPRTPAFGAALAGGLMAGAIGSHLTILGVTLDRAGIDDGGALFAMALIVFISSVTVAVLRRNDFKELLARVTGSTAAS